RHHREGSARPPVERDAVRRQGRAGHPGRRPPTARRHARARVQGQRRDLEQGRVVRKTGLEATPMAEEKKAKASKPAKAAAPREGKPAKGAGEKGASGPTQKGRPRAPQGKPRLATHYLEHVRPALIEKFKYRSSMQAPRFEKIVLNMGVGDALTDA